MGLGLGLSLGLGLGLGLGVGLGLKVRTLVSFCSSPWSCRPAWLAKWSDA